MPNASHSPADPQPSVDPAVAARLKAAVKTLFGSQLAAAKACGLDRTAVNKMLTGTRPPAVALLAGLAARGADVTALLTGGAALSAVPRFAGLLPGPPAAGRDVPVGLAAVPEGVVAPGTYAVTFDANIAAATLGGDPADRPRAGDTVVLVTATAMTFAISREPTGKAVTLPPAGRAGRRRGEAVAGASGAADGLGGPVRGPRTVPGGAGRRVSGLRARRGRARCRRSGSRCGGPGRSETSITGSFGIMKPPTISPADRLTPGFSVRRSRSGCQAEAVSSPRGGWSSLRRGG